MDERQAKRRRVDHDDSVSRSTETVRTVQDLKESLYFRQTLSREAKQGIRRFKDFLNSITTCENTAEQASKLKVLKAYCQDQSSVEKYAPAFPDLLSTWSYAAEHNTDSILSAVPAVLAQFLKIVSSYLEFRDFGISLCQTLLQRDQLRLFERGLSAPVGKAHVISPCLRLLTEMLSFDGGAIAPDLFAKRDPLFKRLDVFLSETLNTTSEEYTDRGKPTLRRIAQRFVLANLKYQDASVIGELILQGKVLHSMLRGLDYDAPDIVTDILQAVDKQILCDLSIPRSLKGRFLNPSNLASLLRLYGYEQLSDNPEGHLNVRDAVNKFLLSICTEPGKGLLVAQSGWYPAGMNPEAQYHESSKPGQIELGMESPAYFDEYMESVPIKNGTLSTFIKSLRPEKDTLQADLLLKIFKAVPELVADYFSKKTKFISTPKDNAEWRGHFAFLFSAIQLPVPSLCGWHEKLPELPPPLSIVIESVLPRPFDRSTLTRCLNLNQELINMSAARAITVALQKLREALRLFSTAPIENKLWSQASHRLIELFLQRTPPVQDIATALQRIPNDNPQLRGAMIGCLALFFKVVRRSSSSVKFDITKALVDLFSRLQEDDLDDETRRLLIDSLPEYLNIAEMLPGTRWWQPSGSTLLNPFTLLLRFCTSSEDNQSVLQQCRKLPHSIMVEKGILRAEASSFQALLTSLKGSKKWSPTFDTFAFIENCMTRIVQHPVRYLDMLENCQRTASDKKPLSLLACCVAEQWVFVGKNPNKSAPKNIAEWIARLFSALDQIGEDFRAMSELQERMLQDSEEKLKSIMQKAIEKQRMKPSAVFTTNKEPGDAFERDDSQSKMDALITLVNLHTTFGPPITNPVSIKGLDRWDQADLESAVANGRVGRLFQCTASPEEEVRRQTYHIILGLMRIVETSTYPFKEQLHLLLGEFAETTKYYSPDFSSPVPSVAAELAAQLARTLSDPADRMYGKINRFLLQSPTWDLDRLISYWVDKTSLSEPEHDDGYHLEVEWLLMILQNGLRVPADLEVYRRAGVWERILALYASAQSTSGARKNILGILWRAMEIGEEGDGKGMLARRAGVGGWLQVMTTRLKTGDEERLVLEALIEQMEAVEESAEMRKWKESMPALRVKTVDYS